MQYDDPGYGYNPDDPSFAHNPGPTGGGYPPTTAASNDIPSGSYNKVATAPDGVPVYRNGTRYFTHNSDGSFTEQFQGGLPDWLQQQINPQKPPVGGDGGGGGGGSAPTPAGSTVGDISQFPTFNPPTPTPQQGLSAPSPYSFTPFVNGTFTAPTLEEAQNQPGYKFGLQQGQQALENSAAARGTLRGGGTLKDLFGYTNAAAEQNYGNVFNQDLTTFNTNEGNRFGAWAANTGQGKIAYDTNWGTAKDVNASGNAANQQNYTNAYQNAAGVFNPQFQASQLTFADSYNRWLAKLNSLTNIATAGAQ